MKNSLMFLLVTPLFLISCWKMEEIKVSEKSPAPAIEQVAKADSSTKDNSSDALKQGSWNIQNDSMTTRVQAPESELIGCVGNSFQSCLQVKKNGESVFIEQYLNWGLLPVDVDSETVEPIFFPNGKKNLVLYLKDKNHLYYPDDESLKKIENFNPKNLVIIPGEGPWIGWAATIYITDRKNVYFGNTKVSDADVASFLVFPESYYSKDKNYVYFLGDYCQKTPECATDGSNYKKVPWADPLSFTVLWWTAGSYAKDKNQAYFNGNVITWADASTFEFVGSEGIWWDWAKDMNQVYSLDTVFESGSVDPATFTMNENWEVSDKNHPKGW